MYAKEKALHITEVTYRAMGYCPTQCDFENESKGEGQRIQKNQVIQSQELTCERSRRKGDAPVVTEPVHVPIPRAIVTQVEAQRVPPTVRAAKSLTIEEDVRPVVVRLLSSRYPSSRTLVN